ncbi:MAG: hypothetical protein LBR32_03960 [Propionibacteriaceae bacterium]|jgi:hypothetical protein|nr:hypothetical protein [Propionibacteriaceae bacterium]
MSEYQAPVGNPEDTGSFGWAVLAFFIPLVGLILWLVWKDTRPKDSTMSRNGFIVSLVLGVLFFIVSLIVGATLAASVGSLS